MKSTLPLFLAVCFAAFGLQAQNAGIHNNGTDPSVTQAAQRNEFAKSFTLSGSEHAIVNGVYALNGLNRLGQPRYTHSSGDYDLNYDGNGNWWLNTDKNLSGGTQYYRAAGNSNDPPLANWMDDKGQQTTLMLVADPGNAAIDAQKNAPKPVVNYISREGTDDIDPNQVIEVKQVPATQNLNGGTTTISRGANAENGFPANGYIYNLRVGWYRINDDGGGCDFSGESPDPRYIVNTSNGLSFSQTINPGDDKNCGWQRMDNDGRYMLPGEYEVTSSASPFQFTMGIMAWEEDNCGDENTYNDDCTFNDDDHPASTSTTVTLDPSMMNQGYNSMEINWSGNGAQYGLRLEWELLPTLKIVTLYSDANLSGRTQHFGEGSYDVNTLFTGVGNDNITSMLIPVGYKVIAFNNSDYVGYPIEFRGTVNNVGGPNKTISSFQVVADNTPPNTDKTLLIYFNGSGKSLEYQLQRFAPEVNADQMIFIKGIGGDNKDYTNYNQQGLQYREGEIINTYVGVELLPPFATLFSSTAKVFKNDNNGGGFDRYFFGVDMDYDGSAGPGYEDEDSYTAAANVLRVLRRYNLKGYSRIVISGHSRGAAVGIASLLYGMKKAVENDPKFSEFQGLVNDIFGAATTINVLALDPVAGSTTIGFRNDYHMGSTWRAREIYQWLKGRYTNINFSEIYANGGRMLDAEDIAGFGFLFPNNTFDPSPNYLHEEPSNNVQRYWLGYRHSSMINKTEKWTYIYDAEGIQRPWLLTAAMLNAGLHDQTLFRNHQHWYDAFHENDQRAWLQALEQDGCTESASAQVGLNPLAVPDSDLEFQHYHGTRHTTFNNSDDSPVNMDAFVGNNNIKFHCSDEYKIPANADLYEASNSYTENDGWTHYCTCQGKRLLSLKLGGTGADVPTNGVSFKEANNSYYVPGGSGFIANPGGAVMMGRSWNVNPTTQPNSPVGVRYYFRHSDVENINATFTMRNEPPVSDVTRLFLYKATSGAAHANAADIPTANILKNGFTPSIDTWVYGLTLRGDFSAEYQVASFSGGGAGGISCTTPTASIAVTNNCGGAFLDLTSNAATYRWSNSATTADITVTTLGTYTVTVTSEFGGCTVTATAQATGDSQAPSITCPANIAVANTTNLCSAIASYITPVGTDNCPSPSTIQTAGLASGSSFPVGATTNIFKVTDAAGNTATCAFAVSVTDVQLPTITCPANIAIANTTDQCSRIVSYTTPVGTDNCPNPNTLQTSGLASGASFPAGVVTINRFRVTDGGGNSATCAFTVAVFDTQIPTITCPANMSIANTTGQCSGIAFYTTPVGTDNCSNPNTLQTSGLPSGSAFPVGSTINGFRVTDGAGSSATCAFTVTVFDTQLPAITCPGNIAVSNTTNLCSATVSYSTPVGTDNCPSPTTLQTAGLPSGGAFPVGLTTNSFRVTDGASNSATCAFTITVTDTQAPSITCPANKTANATNSPVCTTVVNGIDAVFSDNCSAVLSYARSGITTGSGSGSASGQVFNKGLTTVTYTATDGPGNSATCSFNVNVTCEIVFTGRIIWKQDNTSGVKDVTVALSGDQTAGSVTPLNGNYSITVPPGANFMLTPTKTLNKFNGVNAQDVFRIQQHLSGNLLTDPYQLVAADVNSNNVISSLDANIIQLSMLGNPQAVAQFINSWRFVPTTHVMTNPPWGFPEKITYTGISENQTGKDFYGIKVGDVAPLYANPANLAPEPPFVLTTNDEVLQAGNELEVKMQASQIEDLTAMQFGLHFDPQRLELTAIESQSALPLSEDNFGLYEKDLGRINFLWAGTESMDVPESAPVFRLKFKVLTSGGQLSEALQLSDETLPGLAFKGNNAEAEVLLHYFGATGVSGTNNPGVNTPRLQLLQNQPNPFTSRTLIGFELPEACAAQLRIMDASGRVIAVRTKQYPAGLHSEVFELEGVSGVLYYELTTPFGVLSKKMVVIKG